MRSHAIRKTASDRILNAINIGVLSLVLLVVLYPLYFVIIASFSDPNAVYNGQVLFWPKGFVLEGYQRIFSDHIIWRSYFNTAIYTVCGTAIALFLTMSIAFPLSRRYFKGRSVVTILLIIPMYFSGGLIPGYLNVKDLGLINSLWSLILPGAISTYNLIIMKTAFASVPDALPESAQIDGARHLTILARIMVPLSAPTIAVLVLYYAVGHWNAWFSASIYLQDSTLHPLQLVMRNILNSADVSEMLGDVGGEDQARYVELIKYALIMVSTVPILVLYPFLQKYFVKGVMIGAIKG